MVDEPAVWQNWWRRVSSLLFGGRPQHTPPPPPPYEHWCVMWIERTINEQTEQRPGVWCEYCKIYIYTSPSIKQFQFITHKFIFQLITLAEYSFTIGRKLFIALLYVLRNHFSFEFEFLANAWWCAGTYFLFSFIFYVFLEWSVGEGNQFECCVITSTSYSRIISAIVSHLSWRWRWEMFDARTVIGLDSTLSEFIVAAGTSIQSQDKTARLR